VKGEGGLQGAVPETKVFMAGRGAGSTSMQCGETKVWGCVTYVLDCPSCTSCSNGGLRRRRRHAPRKRFGYDWVSHLPCPWSCGSYRHMH
jgi:hypothetical protein